MLRYVGAAVVVLILLAVALYPRGDRTPFQREPDGPAPAVTVATGPDGRVITVSHAVRGSVTRATLVYELGGKDRTAAVETDCRRGEGAVADDGYATVVELTGTLPEGASRLRLVVESETGTDTFAIEP